MLEFFFGILILFLLIMTFIEIFIVISSSKLNINENLSILLIPIKGHTENAEFILKNTILKYNFFKSYKNTIIVCLDLNMDYETRQICNIISSKYNYVYVLTPEEFLDGIKKVE